jgi:drug/metabolite transporter (DMT)-like permease
LKPWKAELSLLLITFIWGGTFFFTKEGLGFAPPSVYVFIRFSIALILSFALFGKNLKHINKKHIRHGLILGLIFGGGFLFQTYGLMYTTISKSAFITGITVPVVPFVYWLIEKTRVKFWSKVGVVVASLGLWLFTNPSFENINIGDLLTLVSIFFWAFYITYMDVFTRGTNDFKLTSSLVILQFVAAAPLALISILLVDLNGFYFNFSQDLVVSLAYNAIVASLIVTLIHTNVQKYSTPVKAALIFALEPIVATAVAVVFAGDEIGPRQFVGGSIMIIGVLASETGEMITKSLRGHLFRQSR